MDIKENYFSRKKRKNRYKLNLLSMLKIQLDGKIYIYIYTYVFIIFWIRILKNARKFFVRELILASKQTFTYHWNIRSSILQLTRNKQIGVKRISNLYPFEQGTPLFRTSYISNFQRCYSNNSEKASDIVT